MRGWLAVTLTLLAGMSTPVAGSEMDDVARTWNAAVVAIRIEAPDLRRVVLGGRIDADYIVDILDGMTPQYPQPAIIFLPDCDYRYNDPEARQQIKFMASLGYVVWAPDSFARENRPTSCDLQERRFESDAPNEQIHELRREEANYAIAQVLSLPWVDRDRIFLVGAGEGADALLSFDHEALAGRIAVSPSCTFGATQVRIPTFVMRADRDVWYDSEHWPEATDACERLFRNDPGVEIATVSGALHDPLIYPEARTRFSNFIIRAAFF
jgi:dienelactone hydrolase